MNNNYYMQKSQYFSILKALHDVCRNNPAPKLTGMEAYNEIINYLYLRHLSDNNPDLEEKYTLKYYYKKYCTKSKIEEDEHNNNLNIECSRSGARTELNHEKLSKYFLPRLINADENENIGFVKIMDNKINEMQITIGRLTNLLHKEDGASFNPGGHKAQMLINKIYEKGFLPTDKDGKFNIRLFPYDALGEGFERFMKDAGSTGGNWGQYFTNQQVVSWINQKMDIKKTDKIIDPFAGSGGFILNAKREFNVDGKNIYAQDNGDNIYKFLKFNSNIAGIRPENITKGDSYDYLKFIQKNLGKFDKVLTNPPFGESINISLSVKDSPKSNFWNLLQTGKKTIKDSLGLGTFMIPHFLKKDGRAGFVVGQNILNNGLTKNSWEKKLRKYLIENYNITDILDLPAGIFSHTNYATSCIILQNNGKTNNITFHKGYFNDKDKGKGDKELFIKENFLKVSFKDLVNSDWSLNINSFIEEEDISIKGVQYKTLGEVCEFYDGYPFKSDKFINKNTKKNITPIIRISDFNENNIYFENIKFYETNDIFNKSIIKNNSFIIALSGNTAGKSFYINDNFTIKAYINQRIIGIYSKIINIKYIYIIFILLLKKSLLQEAISNSNAQPNISKKNVLKLKIPILPKDHQERIVENLDKIFDNDYKQLDSMVSTYKDYDLFKILLNENYDDFEKLKTFEKHIKSLQEIIKVKETYGKQLYMKKCFFDIKGTYKTLGEVCEFNIGGTPPSKDPQYWNGEYKWISISDLNNGIIYNTERKITKKGADKLGKNRLIPKNSILYSFKMIKNGGGVPVGGLTAVKNYIDELNGCIEIKSALNSGSVITIGMPVEFADESNEVVVNKKVDINLTNKLDVLVVEDNELALFALQGMLLDYDVNIDVAKDGKSALKMIKDKSYNIVFIDNELPYISGYEIINLSKADGFLDDTVVIMLTSQGGKNTKNIGCHEYVVKPMQKDILSGIFIKYFD